MKKFAALLALSVTMLNASHALAEVDEGSNVCLRTINGRLVVVPGKCPASSREFTLETMRNFVSDTGDKGVAGYKGFRGKRGEKGDRGADGDAGASRFEVMPPLKTIIGSVGGTFTTSQAIDGNRARFSVLQSMHAVLPTALDNAVVIIASTPATKSCTGGGNSCIAQEEIAVSSLCTGSVTKPTAPPGKLCIYPTVVSNVITLIGDGVGKSGFEIRWASEPSSEASTEIQAVWAYTAP